MFTIRSVFADQGRIESGSFDLIPTNDQGKAVCALFLDFLSSRGLEFREKLPFLKKGETELEWAAASGGAALASFYESGEPLCMAILLSGINPEADRQMIAALRQTVLDAVLGPQAESFAGAPERPIALNVIFPDHAELVPQTQLLITALASVYFRVMLELGADTKQRAP